MAECARVFQVEWGEDSSATVMARLSALSGSGNFTDVQGEGNWFLQADFSSIVANVFDLDSSTPTTAIDTETLTIASVIFDTPQDTAQQVWVQDDIGYNFRYDISNTIFATGNHFYVVEIKATLASGDVFHFIYEGDAQPVIAS